MTSATERREALKQVWEQARNCRACALHTTRTTVVFGAGNADADLMFVGEAPGANEDKQGLPFVGAAGKLLDQLLSEIGIERSEVFIANTLKCRPPENRNPMPLELEACQTYLFSQLELIEPVVVCTLGNFATKLLRGDPTGISRLHGTAEIRQIGPRVVRLYPLYHPAAALYTRATLDLLREDFSRIPELLELGAPPQPEPETRPQIEPSAQPALESLSRMEPSGRPLPDPPALMFSGETDGGAAEAAGDPGELDDAPGATDDAPGATDDAPGATDDAPGEQLGLF